MTVETTGSPRHSLGLVVGKFAPLHLGHEWLIEQSASHCEHLLLLSYSKPLPVVQWPVRQKRQGLVLEYLKYTLFIKIAGLIHL